MENKKNSYLLKVLLFALSDPNFGGTYEVP